MVLFFCICVFWFSVFFQLDVAAATAFRHSVPEAILQRPLQLQQEALSNGARSAVAAAAANAAATGVADAAAANGAAAVRPPPSILTASSLSAAEAARANSTSPMVRLYGVTADGRSVVCNVHGFFPYCYVECPGPLAAAMRAAAPAAGAGAGQGCCGWQQNAVTEALRAVIDVRLVKCSWLALAIHTANCCPSYAGVDVFYITALIHYKGKDREGAFKGVFEYELYDLKYERTGKYG